MYCIHRHCAKREREFLYPPSTLDDVSCYLKKNCFFFFIRSNVENVWRKGDKNEKISKIHYLFPGAFSLSLSLAGSSIHKTKWNLKSTVCVKYPKNLAIVFQKWWWCGLSQFLSLIRRHSEVSWMMTKVKFICATAWDGFFFCYCWYKTFYDFDLSESVRKLNWNIVTERRRIVNDYFSFTSSRERPQAFLSKEEKLILWIITSFVKISSKKKLEVHRRRNWENQ